MDSMICVIVAGISGLFCAPDAQAPAQAAQCRQTWYGQECEVDDLPVFPSTYDPAICQDHPINCSDPSDPWHGAVRRLSPDDYGRVAACPLDWLNRTIEIADIPLAVKCEDTGGRIMPMYREVWVFDGPPHIEMMWVIVIDVLWNHTADPWPWWSLRTWEGAIL